MKNINYFTQWKNGSVHVTFKREITHQKHLVQSGRSTRSAVDIFKTLRPEINKSSWSVWVKHNESPHFHRTIIGHFIWNPYTPCARFTVKSLTGAVWFSNGMTCWATPFEVHTPSVQYCDSIYNRGCTHIQGPKLTFLATRQSDG